ncbi:glycosyltransferase family 2 protein [Hafnia alvei]|uniref:glycosyltransferase family 2 protein n=1 Tax=Hafnia alvei TaxID=569 RepID=UPI004043993C
MEYECSVVIPIYNEENNIKSCLDALLEQVGIKFEVILVNDGSTDKSDEIIKNLIYKHPNIHYISQTNKGAALARLAGISRSNTNYIAVLDCDDRLDNYALVNAMSEFRKSDDVDLSLFDLHIECSDGKDNIKFHYTINHWPVSGIYAFSHTIEHWGLHAFGIYKKNVLISGYDMAGILAENNVNDDELISRCAILQCNRVSLSTGKYTYGMNEGSTTRGVNANLYKMLFTALKLKKIILDNAELNFLEGKVNLFILRVCSNVYLKFYKYGKRLDNNDKWISALKLGMDSVDYKVLKSELKNRKILCIWSLLKLLYLKVRFGYKL